jgi:hypothetical protein
MPAARPFGISSATVSVIQARPGLGLETRSFAWLAFDPPSRFAKLEVESAVQPGIAYRRGLVDVDCLLIGIIERQRAVRIERLELEEHVRALRMHRSARVGPPANGNCQAHQHSIAQPSRQAARSLTSSLLLHRLPPSFLTGMEDIGLAALCGEGPPARRVLPNGKPASHHS